MQKAIIQSESLKKHINLVQRRKKPYQFQELQELFSMPINLRKHIKMWHSENKLHKCGQCFKSFNLVNLLETHELEHLRTVEKSNEPYTCIECDKTFSIKNSLEYHSISKHGKSIHSGMPTKCLKCDRTFTVSSTFRYHMMKHSGEKPYVCSLCCRAFI